MSAAQNRNAVTALITRLAAYAGFDEEVVAPARMDSIVARRQRARGMDRADRYLELVENDAEEHDALLNEVLVGETRFFRDTKVFEHLLDWLRKQRAAVPQKTFRVLCAPCSTGEEAYSVAAALQMAGFTADQYEIEALDISRSALETAERGVYASHALRGVPEERRAQLVEAAEEGFWRVLPQLRAGLNFSFANLSLPGSLKPLGEFDLILCRNLLIYLRPEARLNLLCSVRDALSAGGRLIVGTGDAVPEIYTIFQAARPASSFMLEVKSAAAQRMEGPARSKAVQPQPVVAWRAAQAAPQRARESAALKEPVDFYRAAVELYEKEELRASERYCRKALYLEPALVPALELLEQLWRNEPVSRRQRALAERLQRARSQQESA